MFRALFTLAAGIAVAMGPLPGNDGSASVGTGQARLEAGRRRTAAPAVTAARPEPPVPPSPGHGPHTRFLPASGPRELILSFDDGPELRTTPLVLEQLDRRGLKAIFFISGWRLLSDRPESLARRDLVRKVASHGHLIANHTMHHKNLCEVSASEAEREIDGNTELITAATGLRPLLFRSPYGAVCKSLEAALEARELTDIGWNLDPQDWKTDDEDWVFGYVTGKLARLAGRGILLMHDTKAGSAHALPRILDWIERENEAAVAGGRAPIRILDYSVFLPDRPVPPSGLETILADLGGSFDLLPGFAAVRSRAGAL